MKKLGVILSVLVMLLIGATLYAQDEKPQPSEEAPPKKVEKPAPVNYTSFGGGIQVISMTTLGNNVYTDFFQRASVYMKGNIVPKKMGYFAHIMYLSYPDYTKNTYVKKAFEAPVAFVWWNPAPFVNLRFGNLKKPSEWTYLPPWQLWLFETTPMIFKTMKGEGMTFVDVGAQAVANYKKLVYLQVNAFRTNYSVTNKGFNLLYFTGLKVTPPPIKGVSLGIAGYYGFEPHNGGTYSYTLTDGTSVAVPVNRNSLLALFWAKFMGAHLFVEYISYNRSGEIADRNISLDVTSTDLDVELSYKLKVKGLCLRPKVRYEMYDPNTSRDGDSKQAAVVGVDFIMAKNLKSKMMYKFALEYQLNMEETNEVDNDQIRLVFQVGNF